MDKISKSMIPSISVDYAVMKKSHYISVVHSEFRWSDMGSFDSPADHLAEKKELKLEENGNFAIWCD